MSSRIKFLCSRIKFLKGTLRSSALPINTNVSLSVCMYVCMSVEIVVDGVRGLGPAKGGWVNEV